MKRIVLMFGLLTVLLGLAACGTTVVAPASGTTPEAPRSISVTGDGKASVTPDIALASVGVESRDVDISKAVDDNISKTAAVVAAIKAQGVKEADIQTSNFSVYWQETYDTTGQPTGQGRYIVNNAVSVTVREIPKLGSILGDALTAGANSVGGVNFSVEDPTAALQEARTKAVANARAKAEEIALGLDIKVGKVLSVNEYGATIPMAMDKGYAAGMGGGGAVPVSAGTYEVTMTISVVFEIQ